jgi:hypothetical protein
MAFFGDDEGGPVQCSTPILLDFPISPKVEEKDGCKLEKAKEYRNGQHGEGGNEEEERNKESEHFILSKI